MRTKLPRWIICVIVAVLLAKPPFLFSDEPSESVHIGGAGIAGTDWTVDQMQKQFAAEIKPIAYSGHGQKHVYRCIALISLLKAAGIPAGLKMDPKADPKTKSYSLRFVAVVRGRDGYVIAFSLAELLPEIGNRQVWVALDEDGQPISEQDGPIRLLSPDDQKPARSVHQLTQITIVDTAAATTRPDTAP
jgi:hypothetical protein